jgi:two-component system, OmpR family, KDP operon response regulator KdpE
MPNIDGVDVCRRVRAFSRVPSLVLSALADERFKVQALDAGADAYVTRPFRVEELLARVRAAVRRGEAQRDDTAVLRVSGLEIDQIVRTVDVDGGEVHLTPTQYELLRFLANILTECSPSGRGLVFVPSVAIADETAPRQRFRTHVR